MKTFPCILIKEVVHGFCIESTSLKELPQNVAPRFYFTGNKFHHKRLFCYCVNLKGDYLTPMADEMVLDVSDFDDVNETASAMHANSNYTKLWDEMNRLGAETADWVKALIIGLPILAILFIMWGGGQIGV